MLSVELVWLRLSKSLTSTSMVVGLIPSLLGTAQVLDWVLRLLEPLFWSTLSSLPLTPRGMPEIPMCRYVLNHFSYYLVSVSDSVALFFLAGCMNNNNNVMNCGTT